MASCQEVKEFGREVKADILIDHSQNHPPIYWHLRAVHSAAAHPPYRILYDWRIGLFRRTRMEALYIPLSHGITKANVGFPLVCANRGRDVLAQPRPSNVDRRCVQMGLMRSVEFFDHLDAGTTILSDLVDIGSLDQPKADVCVRQAIGGAPIAVAVEL